MQVNLIGPQIKELFENSKTALVVLGENPSADQSCLAASLVELFVSYKKEAVLVSRSPLPEAAKPLVKVEQLKTFVDPKSLVLSFDWAKAGLERVSYKIEGEKFNLVIHSKGRKLDQKDVEFHYQGANFDLVITVGVQKVEDLAVVGLDQETFDSLPTLNLDCSVSNTNFAKLNIVNEKADSICALAIGAFVQGQITLPTRAAENLFYGLRIATNNFSEVNDPTTFEAAAVCKRAMIPFFAKNEESSEELVTKTEVKNEEKTPEAWLEPKVFRSRGVG